MEEGKSLARDSVKSILLSCFTCTVCFAFWYFLILWQSTITPQIRVIACDVGQGDATLIKYDQLVILVDVGPNSAIKQCLQANISPLRPVIDLLVLTHDDSDHIGGFSDGLRGYTIRKLFINPKIKDTKSADVISQWMRDVSRFTHPHLSETYSFPGLHLSIVWNEEALVSQFGLKALEEGSNNASLGIYVESQGFGFLGLGDLGCAQELAVSTSLLLKKVHILKMSHHGSKTSSCLEYLKFIHPEAAYYSAIKGNSYGHPSPLSLENVRSVGSFILGTDQSGSINYTWNGRKLLFRTSR